MILTLRRISQGHFGTFGMLLAGDKPLCVTCEEPWKANAPNVSCIAAGTYSCIRHDTPKFPNVWEVTGVPGRTGILIHAGNTIKDTRGCILVGQEFLRNSDFTIYGVGKSRAALDMLRQTLLDAFTLVVEAVPPDGPGGK
ncbi:hypothetical protein OJF2_50740 [Aquisphaera giovannonii]|uniref:DUF5675 domain-containing protein n=1 Tax=Aquisphaera giovannonii TaxID=406548 RepID=A0A5B9W9I6_9BACT|nr:DUF5675 family protein [Aquisphaera giovannonii]QEH36490.1 hypothetical protein OJF2_50740 [Aquisphaera giovannonii]